MNLLNLISLQLNIICQVTTKYTTVPKLTIFHQLNMSSVRCNPFFLRERTAAYIENKGTLQTILKERTLIERENTTRSLQLLFLFFLWQSRPQSSTVREERQSSFNPPIATTFANRRADTGPSRRILWPCAKS